MMWSIRNGDGRLGMKFLITLLPLLFGASVEDVRAVLAHWQLLIVSGVAGGIYLAMLFGSYTYLSVGTGTSISRALSTIVVAIFAWLFLGETLSPLSMVLMGVIIVGTILLGTQHTHFSHLDNRFALGVAVAAVSSIPVAFIVYSLTVLSRDADPFVSGYVWETSIGIANTIASGVLVISAILAHIFYNEKLAKGEWASMVLILAGIVLLKFV